MSKTELFHRSRILFAIINDKLVFTMFESRSHKDWLKETYNIDAKEFEGLVRGYMKDGEVFFYTTSEFKKIDLKHLGIDSLNHLLILSTVYMNARNPECFNGLYIGEQGTKWKPIDRLGTIQDIVSQRFRSYGIVQ